MAAYQNAQTPVSIAYVTAPATSAATQGNAPASSPNQHFKVRAAMITGYIQIACAVLSVTFGFFAILVATCVIGKGCKWNYIPFPAIIGWPIWGGVLFYFVAGILGVCSKNRNTCMIVAYMCMSIISSISAFGQLVIDIIGASINTGLCSSNDVCPLPVIHSVSAAVAFVEIMVAIVGAAYCCHGVCCRPSSPAPQQVLVHWAEQAQGQVFQQPPPGPFQLNTQPPTGSFQLNAQNKGFYPPPTAPLQLNAPVFPQPSYVQLCNQPNQPQYY